MLNVFPNQKASLVVLTHHERAVETVQLVETFHLGMVVEGMLHYLVHGLASTGENRQVVPSKMRTDIITIQSLLVKARLVLW